MKPGVAAALEAGRLHEGQGRWQDAKAAYERALRRDPRSADALCRLAAIEERAGGPDRAMQLLRRAVAAQPDLPGLLISLGLALQRQGRTEAALEQFSRALARDGSDLAALSNRGAMLLLLRRPAAALADFDRVLASQGGSLAALSNRGAALLQLQRPQDALACFDRVAAARPAQADAHTARGVALHNLRRTPEALACFEQALRLHPGDPAAQVAAAECRLLSGDLPRGWPGHIAGAQHPAPLPGVPRWTGQEDLAGRTVLLFAQQGLGDTVQFCRYAPLVAAQGATVVMQVQAPLLPLLATLAGPHRLVAEGAPLPPCDLQCALPHLPGAFGTALDSIPDGAPTGVPYLAADPLRVQAWSARLGPRTRPRVGLAWSGNPDHLNDHNRSVPFALLAPLLEADAEFVSLQPDVRPNDDAALAASGVRRHGDALADFGDTAALAALMDVVVCVDTSVAHVAGALGRPTWLLLPWVAEWRWMLDRSDSPWYPDMRLFRQPGLADWPGAVAEVRAALARLPR